MHVRTQADAVERALMGQRAMLARRVKTWPAEDNALAANMIAGLEAALKTLRWVEANAELIKRVHKEKSDVSR
jgi:hypothetical protein